LPEFFPTSFRAMGDFRIGWNIVDTQTHSVTAQMPPEGSSQLHNQAAKK
jgi:hypothetical protein